jgi:riboflavin synthase
MVQGNVDQTETYIGNPVLQICSWYYTSIGRLNNLTIEKVQLTVNGVGLTVVNSKKINLALPVIPLHLRTH